MSALHILVTGGSGYIGSHTVLELLNQGYQVTVLDNLSNSSEESLRRVKELTGKGDALTFVKADLCNMKEVESVFTNNSFFAVIHFAGLKSVGESVSQPLFYYQNNVTGTLNLLEAMKGSQCKNIVFSSSATVYGAADSVPVTEASALKPTNPYGKTKYFIEEILRDVGVSDPSWNIVLLRYFNPVGAHPSGRIGEDPKGIPNNLMPFVQQVAVGRRSAVQVFGSDWPTPDGTGVRDYIHVVDLALGHVAALERIKENVGTDVYNLGTGKGYSVLEIIEEMRGASGHAIPYVLAPRRPGDIACLYAETSKAEKELRWTAKKSLAEMCVDAWRWQSSNPYGFSANEA